MGAPEATALGVLAIGAVAATSSAWRDATQEIVVWFAKGSEKRQVDWLKRGMTKDQAERFQRAVEAEKASEGRGGRDNLPRERLEGIRNDILEGRR